MLQILIASFVIMTASLSGVVFLWKGLGKVIEKNLSYLVSFSAGVFLVVTYQLAVETTKLSSTPSMGFVWILVGTIFIYSIFKLLPDFHHHHDEEEEKEHKHKSIDARRILISDGIHNIGDGILLVTSFTVDEAIGIITVISIFIHEFLQEVSEFFVLRQSGMSTKKALLLNFLDSGTILIGALGGFFLLERFKTFEGPLLGISAGAFLIVVINDLIPSSVRASRKKKDYIKHISWFIVGAILMVGINLGADIIFG